MAAPSEHTKTKGVRQVLSSLDDVRAAVVEVTGIADRTLSIFTHDLEPGIYDHDDFLETLKRFILSRGFARVRVLVVDPTRVITTASRFVNVRSSKRNYI